tara:strand:+ start:1214 stop:2134 length:921 start_codon:yes stop_codon:yes gene_type:complete
MNILITGVLGHIGSLLIKKISKTKNLKTIYLIDSARSNNLNVLFNLKLKNKIKFIHGDLLDKKILNNIKSTINVVIHLASITNAEASFKHKKLIYKNNYGIFRNIVKFCIKKKSKLIHLSSTSVYGAQEFLVDENTKNLQPQSPYAHVKLMEENYLKRYKNQIKYCTLRLGTITGISKGMRFHTAVNKFCFKTIVGEKIPVWNNAIDQYRPYLSLKDAIKVMNFIIQNNLFNNETYNILTKNYTVREILNIIKKNNYKLKIIKTNSPILNQNSYKVSNNKFSKFKVKLSKSIDKDIKDTLNMLKNL